MESKNYHFNVSNPELISKIERFNEYGFANRTDFFLEAIKVHIPQELRIRSRGTERHSASN